MNTTIADETTHILLVPVRTGAEPAVWVDDVVAQVVASPGFAAADPTGLAELFVEVADSSHPSGFAWRVLVLIAPLGGVLVFELGAARGEGDASDSLRRAALVSGDAPLGVSVDESMEAGVPVVVCTRFSGDEDGQHGTVVASAAIAARRQHPTQGPIDLVMETQTTQLGSLVDALPGVTDYLRTIDLDDLFAEL